MNRLLTILFVLRNVLRRSTRDKREYVLLENETDIDEFEEVFDDSQAFGDVPMVNLEERRKLRALETKPNYKYLDKVPCMEKPGGGFVVLKEDSPEAKEVMENPDDHRGARAGRLHQALPWVFYNTDDAEAAKILRNYNPDYHEEGLFLVGFNKGKPNLYYLAPEGRVGVVRIQCTRAPKTGEPGFYFCWHHTFRDLVDLVQHCRETSNVALSCRLTNAVTRKLADEPEFLPF